MSAPPLEPVVDWEWLQAKQTTLWGRSQRTTLWLLGLLLFFAGTVVALVLYLQTFEAEDVQRRRVSSTQWLEHSVRFHFRRLEDDLEVLAQMVRERGAQQQIDQVEGLRAGLLLREAGVIVAHGWLPAGDAGAGAPIQQRLQHDMAAHPANTESLAVMLSIAQNLRRPSYAGPLRDVRGASDGAQHTMWLATPLFERGVFVGHYLAVFSLDRAIGTVVPAWFLNQHAVRIVDEEQMLLTDPASPEVYLAHLEMPGVDMALQVQDAASESSSVPRIFFGVALLCLVGMLASVYALQGDVAKRHRTEVLLQAQVALRTAMENAVTVGLRAWDRQGRVLYVNKAFCTMVGFEAHELLGKKAPLPYWPQAHVDELKAIHQGLMVTGTQRAGVEIQFQHKNGQLIDVLIHEAALHAAGGEPIGWMSSVIDISERKRAERMAARQQQKFETSGRLVAMGEVASTLAHELNQPLGALSGFANGLLNRLRGGRLNDADLVSVVERMEQLAAKAGRIIQRVNAFARRREMVRQRTDVGAFLRHCMAPLQKQRAIAVQLLLPTQPLWMEADALLLEHALMNLVSNAEHWACQAGHVPALVVSAHAEGDTLTIAVHDSGPGVAAEHREHIFHAFFTGKDDGMGMGLAICRSVVEAHHGRVEVGASHLLSGACFTMHLPLAVPAPRVDPSSS